jgi:hypothetical protein
MRRIVVAFIALPIVGYLVYAVVIFLFGLATEPVSWEYMAGMGLILLPITYSIHIPLALPVIALAIHFRWLSAWHAVVAGTAVAYLAFAFPALRVLFDDNLHLHYRLERFLDPLPFAMVGAAFGLLFWLLAIWRNTYLQRPHAEHRSVAA